MTVYLPHHAPVQARCQPSPTPATIDAPALAAAADVGAATLRRRDAAVREALEHVSLRDLVGDPDAAPLLAQLRRERLG